MLSPAHSQSLVVTDCNPPKSTASDRALRFPASCAGVMSLDFHPDHPALLAVGQYDGTVSIYDVHADPPRQLHQSTISTGRHLKPVWQVR